MTPAETEAEGTLHQLVTGPYIGIRQVGRLIISSFLHDDDGNFAHSRNCNFCGAMLRGYFCLGNDPCNAPRHRQIQNVMKPNLGPASPINIHSSLSFHRFIANILPRSFSYKNLPKILFPGFLDFTEFGQTGGLPPQFVWLQLHYQEFQEALVVNNKKVE